ncbi:MAG: class I SAM-dependent methyltransferase, partial [Candidatus Hodarchaeota archaeon]
MADNESTQDPILSTMAGPLYARATFSQLYPDLLHDLKAAEILEKMKTKHPEAEWATLQEFVDEMLGLNFLVRARTYDEGVKTFIVKHPQASVVNIGCGLDTTFSRVDNGIIKWYNLDLPDAIEYRKELLPDSSRNKCISGSVFDYEWFDEIEFEPEKGIFFFAGGLFNYFKEKEVINLCRAMTDRFPGGELIFDAPSKYGNKIMNRRFKRLGVKGIRFYFGLDNP